LIAFPYIRSLRFRASFDPKRDVHSAIPLFDTRTRGRLPNRATYVLVQVESIRKNYIADCTGAITKLEKLDDKGNVIARLQGTRPLIWSPQERGLLTQTIAPYVPQDMDVFRTIEGVNTLELMCIGHPPSWSSFFTEQGKYRITVAVTGDGRTTTVTVPVTWRGRWDNFEVV
jgi:hypothetical protein